MSLGTLILQLDW